MSLFLQQGAEMWVNVVRGYVACLLIGRCMDCNGLFSIESPTWKKQHRGERVKKIIGQLSNLGMAATELLDRAVTWTIGDKPTDKERLTWTSPRFRCQRQVRSDQSAGQGYSKRQTTRRTSEWFKTTAIVCLMATPEHANTTRFDSDSVILHVDNCASRCITNSINDFVAAPQKVIGRVLGMGGDKVAVQVVGTIRWTFDNDDEVFHAFLIPGFLYIPDSPARLFSPQYWAQELKDNVPHKNGTWQATFADHYMHLWGQQKYCRQIPLDKSNVATFSTTAGCMKFRVFQACLEAVESDGDEDNAYTAFDVTLIVDNEEDFQAELTPADEDVDDGVSIDPIQQQPTRGPGRADDDNDPGYTKTTGHHETSYDKYSATVEDARGLGQI
jgi:hypothetical protein